MPPQDLHIPELESWMAVPDTKASFQQLKMIKILQKIVDT